MPTASQSPKMHKYPNNEVVTLLSWHAPGRPYKKRSKEYYLNAAVILMAVEICVFLFKDYAVMAVIASLGLLAFALAIVPPHQYYYKISTEGILIEDRFYIWEELYDFYFMPRFGMNVLHIRTDSYYPGELMMVLGDVPIEQVKSTLLPFLPYREYMEPTFMDKASIWLEKNIPLEKP